MIVDTLDLNGIDVGRYRLVTTGCKIVCSSKIPEGGTGD
jgi:hypothetical protein